LKKSEAKNRLKKTQCAAVDAVPGHGRRAAPVIVTIAPRRPVPLARGAATILRPRERPKDGRQSRPVPASITTGSLSRFFRHTVAFRMELMPGNTKNAFKFWYLEGSEFGKVKTRSKSQRPAAE
jgi:hypothetical protein